MTTEKYTLSLDRQDICKLMTACTGIAIEMEMEMKHDPDCPEYRREKVLPESIKMWKALRDLINEQLEEQDKKQDWYDPRYYK